MSSSCYHPAPFNLDKAFASDDGIIPLPYKPFSNQAEEGNNILS
jgi:hypothetical protein